MSNLIINIITCIFLVIIVSYSVMNIVANKQLYTYISEDYKRLNEDYQRSLLYNNIKGKYRSYLHKNTYADINITTFIEEVCSDFTFKNKCILEKIRTLKNSSSTCILFGVLGTFVGLSLMLLSINTNDIINSLPETISSMQTAFITSIFGIVCSIIINIFIGRLDCEHVLVQLMLKCENLLTSEVTHEKSQSIDLKIEEVKDTIKQISKSIESIEKFDDIARDLHEFNDEFIGGIEALKNLLLGSQDSIKTFDQSVRKLDKRFDIMNIKFTKLFDKYDNQEDINKEILIDIKQTAKSVFESNENQYKIKEYLRNLSASFGLYERSSQDLLSKLVKHEKEITNRQSNLNEEQINIDTSVRHLASVIALSSQDIEQKLNLIFDYIDIYKEAMTMASMKDEGYKGNEEEIYDVESYNDIMMYQRTSQKERNYKNDKRSLEGKSTKKLKTSSSDYLLGDDRYDK